jgi:hypothetical protein
MSVRHGAEGIVCPSDEIRVEQTIPFSREGLFLNTRQASPAMGGERPDPFINRGRVAQQH